MADLSGLKRSDANTAPPAAKQKQEGAEHFTPNQTSLALPKSRSNALVRSLTNLFEQATIKDLKVGENIKGNGSAPQIKSCSDSENQITPLGATDDEMKPRKLDVPILSLSIDSDQTVGQTACVNPKITGGNNEDELTTKSAPLDSTDTLSATSESDEGNSPNTGQDASQTGNDTDSHQNRDQVPPSNSDSKHSQISSLVNQPTSQDTQTIPADEHEATSNASQSGHDGADNDRREEGSEHSTSEKAIKETGTAEDDSSLAESIGRITLGDSNPSNGEPEKANQLPCALKSEGSSSQAAEGRTELLPGQSSESTGDALTPKTETKTSSSDDTSDHPENKDEAEVVSAPIINHRDESQEVSTSASQSSQNDAAKATPGPEHESSDPAEPDSDETDATSSCGSTESESEVLTPKPLAVELPNPTEEKAREPQTDEDGPNGSGGARGGQGEPVEGTRVRPSVVTDVAHSQTGMGGCAEDGAIPETPAGKGTDDIRYYFHAPSGGVYLLDDFLNVYTDDGTVIYDHSCNSNSGDLLTPSFWIHTTPYWIDQSGLMSQNADGTLYSVELFLCEEPEAPLCNAATFQLERGSSSNDASESFTKNQTYNPPMMFSKRREVAVARKIPEKHQAMEARDLHRPIYNKVLRGGASVLSRHLERYSGLKAHQTPLSKHNRGLTSKSITKRELGVRNSPRVSLLPPSYTVVASLDEDQSEVDGDDELSTTECDVMAPLVDFDDLSPYIPELNELAPVEPLTEEEANILWSPPTLLSQVAIGVSQHFDDGGKRFSGRSSATPPLSTKPGGLSPYNLGLDESVLVEPPPKTEANALWSSPSLLSQATIEVSQHSEISGKRFSGRSSATPPLPTKPSVDKNRSFYATGKLYYFDNRRRLYSEDGTLTYDGSNSTLTKQPLHPNFSIDGTPYWLLLDGLFSRDATDKQYCVLAWPEEPSVDKLGNGFSQPGAPQNGTVALRSSSSPGYRHDSNPVPAITLTPDLSCSTPKSKAECRPPDAHLNPLKSSFLGELLTFSPAVLPGISPSPSAMGTPGIIPTISSGKSAEAPSLFQASQPEYIQNIPAMVGQLDTTTTQQAAPAPQKVNKRSKKGPLCCPICNNGKVWRRPVALQEHMNTHTGAKPYACPFKGCTSRHATKSNMKRHFQTHRLGVEPEDYQLDESEFGEVAPVAAHNPYVVNQIRRLP